MLKKVATGGIGIFLLATPLFASAQIQAQEDPLGALEALIQVLAAKVAALQAQLGTGFTTIAPDSDYPSTPTQGSCPALTVGLMRGSRDATTGGQVTELQIFLATYFNVDEEVLISGYFGKVTEGYVVKFQNQHGLPAYGLVGPMTRAKIREVCGGTPPRPVDGIEVTAPNGGEQWEIGTMNTITWTPYGYNPVINPPSDITAYLQVPDSTYVGGFRTVGRIVPSGKASIHWEGVISSEDNPAEHFVEPGTYYVFVLNHKTGTEDRSDAPFTLLPKSADLKLNGSDGPITVDTNKPVKATWKATNVSRCEIHNAYPDISRQTQVGPVALSGSQNVYTHPSWGPTLYCYKSDGTTVADSVQINVQPSPASLQITSPNGGESIAATDSTQVKIAWRMNNITTPISIALYKDDKWLSWIAKDLGMDLSLDGTYSYVWAPNAKGPALPPLSSGSNSGFKIYITGQKADGTGYVDDKSDAPFSFSNGVAAVEIPTPVFKTFSLHPTSIKEGESSTLVWNVANAKKCILKASDGTEIKDLSWVESRMLAPTRTMTYTLQCINNDLFGNDSPAVSRSVTITVMPGAVTDFSANITGGTAPLPVTFTYRLNVASSCSAGHYSVSFGDEDWAAGDVQQKVSWNAGACAPITQTIPHPYPTPVIYLAQLNDPGVALLGSARITIATGVAVTTATVTLPGTSSSDIVVADANSGTAPFTVTFRYLLNRSASCAEGGYNMYFGDEDWAAGDTATRATWAAGTCAKSIQTLTHTYTQKGIYKMQIFDISSGAGVDAGSELVTVNAPTTSQTNTQLSSIANALVALQELLKRLGQ